VQAQASSLPFEGGDWTPYSLPNGQEGKFIGMASITHRAQEHLTFGQDLAFDELYTGQEASNRAILLAINDYFKEAEEISIPPDNVVFTGSNLHGVTIGQAIDALPEQERATLHPSLLARRDELLPAQHITYHTDLEVKPTGVVKDGKPVVIISKPENSTKKTATTEMLEEAMTQAVNEDNEKVTQYSRPLYENLKASLEKRGFQVESVPYTIHHTGLSNNLLGNYTNVIQDKLADGRTVIYMRTQNIPADEAAQETYRRVFGNDVEIVTIPDDPNDPNDDISVVKGFFHCMVQVLERENP
jgi:transcriptional regulator NrdR family protein